MKLIKNAAAAVLMILSLVGCKRKDYPVTKVTPVDIDSIASNYYEQYLKLYPLEATAQGDTRYNDQLPIDIDKDFIAGAVTFYNSVEKQLKNIDYKSLDARHKVIYDVLDYTLKDRTEHFAYHPEYIPFTQFDGLPLQFPLLGSGKGSQPFKTEKDYDDWLKRMDKFPLWADAAIADFKDGVAANVVLPKSLVVKMIPQMRADEIISEDMSKNIFGGPLKTFPASFTAAQKERLSKAYREEVLTKIIPAYQRLGDFLEKEYLPKARTTDGLNALPNGQNMYRYDVKSWTTTTLSPQQIHKTGLQQVEILQNQMKDVQRQLGFGGTLPEFIRYEAQDPKAMPYKNPKQILDAFNTVLKKIQPGLKTMFSVTPKTPFEIRQTEKFREATASAEYVQGTPDGKRPGIFYVPLPDPKKFNITSGMESLFLHEAIPGHHYQISLQQENTALPKFMRFGWFGAYGEGWAHYCETLGPELGCYTDPYQKMGFLSDQMLRAVRLVVDTGIHTGQMTREQAIKYFMDNIAYDEAGATAEVERYMAVPGQALGYKIGSLKIRELRDKYQKQLGNKFSLAKFHDEVLSQGCLPLDVLERKMNLWAKSQ